MYTHFTILLDANEFLQCFFRGYLVPWIVLMVLKVHNNTFKSQ